MLTNTIIALYVDMSHESIGITLDFQVASIAAAVGECMAFAANHAKDAQVQWPSFWSLGLLSLALFYLATSTAKLLQLPWTHMQDTITKKF